MALLYSKVELNELFSDLESKGFAIARDCIQRQDLDKLRAFYTRVVGRIARKQGLPYNAKDRLETSLLTSLGERPAPLDTRLWDPLVVNSHMHRAVSGGRFLQVLRHILGPEITYQGNGHLRPMMPQELSPLPWHQDAQFYGEGSEGLLNKMLQIWFPLVDVEPNEGCLVFAVGSHKCGLAGGARPRDDNVKTSSRQEQAEIYKAAGSMAARFELSSVPMKAGDVALFRCLTLHSATSNYAYKVRWSLDLRFESTCSEVSLTSSERAAYEIMHKRLKSRRNPFFELSQKRGVEPYACWRTRSEKRELPKI
ncbi:ectoine hydroxylase-related dioxygenase (phytanoyl-CoA dioxygenase family) [Agrobacterium tumefaciens]|uniref:Ectoine hydroxylase-related dioxygenase (Phytanoyl-CoA dioxygenase family) n=1 Tax=Agrobacterium radiobacter TaxID=362 RepID=A0ABR6JCD9_AGRRD|nr:phytanoyl-CoA dioxygenase family protein [Agrobacterium radiobacter]MBB4320477.1 ectoine hydroxylase-related dioxygenase (phytanoyl-CoA dioxygenase family) [Agrobacterium radiobacter]MBB4337142.1 ectoine hydroxylase-related dioxygenase (phytanoyl-CoA dioxygenase family) [Agrobacterium radiobacter]MBB4492610.1 ectoine hydroxylase-related dioxygenase (phytanoyl-CoA dioxygenase family) [Agrobacterium radiobacter]MBB4497508.1 ectoine hydroxylase-related dioxygenase (phytanoyl-CoA dioxygenase fam